MNSISRTFYFLLFGLVTFTFSCKDEEEDVPTTGKLVGQITEAATTDPIVDASVVIFDADANSPVASTTTDAGGSFSQDLDPGNYFIKVSAQGYLQVPPPGVSPISFEIAVGVETTRDVIMFPAAQSNLGSISGSITSGETGVLVVATNGSASYSGISDENGEYIIYNVPAGFYDVQGWIAGYNSSKLAVSVESSTTTEDSNIDLTQDASGIVSVQLRNLAGENKDVDITLVDPLTRETIPGLTGFTTDLSYTFEQVPNGTFIVRATYMNDERVVDPDRIFKFGEPTAEVTGGTVTVEIDITPAVILDRPTNMPDRTVPFEINGTTPTFSWNAYSSTSDYVIEVTDATTGQVSGEDLMKAERCWKKT